MLCRPASAPPSFFPCSLSTTHYRPRSRPPFDNRVDGPIRAMNRTPSNDFLGPGGGSFRPGGRPGPQRGGDRCACLALQGPSCLRLLACKGLPGSLWVGLQVAHRRRCCLYIACTMAVVPQHVDSMHYHRTPCQGGALFHSATLLGCCARSDTRAHGTRAAFPIGWPVTCSCRDISHHSCSFFVAQSAQHLLASMGASGGLFPSNSTHFHCRSNVNTLSLHPASQARRRPSRADGLWPRPACAACAWA